MGTKFYIFPVKFWFFLLFSIVLLFLTIERNLPFDNAIVINQKIGIYYDEYELILNEIEYFKARMDKFNWKYRIDQYLGRYFLQISKSPSQKINTSAGQRGFYRFFQMSGKLFPIDALSNIYILNKEPELFVSQIQRNVENVNVIHIEKKNEIMSIIIEIHTRFHKIIHYARDISEYTKYYEMNSNIYIIKDNLISLEHIQEINKHGPEVGVFIIVWGDENNFHILKNAFERIFLFKGNGLLQNNVLHFNECLYIRNSFVQRIIIEECVS